MSISLRPFSSHCTVLTASRATLQASEDHRLTALVATALLMIFSITSRLPVSTGALRDGQVPRSAQTRGGRQAELPIPLPFNKITTNPPLEGVSNPWVVCPHAWQPSRLKSWQKNNLFFTFRFNQVTWFLPTWVKTHFVSDTLSHSQQILRVHPDNHPQSVLALNTWSYFIQHLIPWGTTRCCVCVSVFPDNSAHSYGIRLFTAIEKELY